MVELEINGQKIDILDTKIKYVKQNSDLADVTKVNASYSYSLTAPKTIRNTRTFKGLGLVGDTSDTPYIKNQTKLTDNGAVVVSNGISYVKETSTDYKLFIQDGVIDFFRRIENKTLGRDLTLTELEHEKNESTIIASWENPNYRYLITDYNGQLVKDFGINIDYQIPSINAKYLLDKIMAFAGYTYEGIPSIIDDWISYPTAPEVPGDAPEVLIFSSSQIQDESFAQGFNWELRYKPQWGAAGPLDNVTLINNWSIRIHHTGNYRVDWGVRGNMYYTFIAPIPFQDPTILTFALPIKMGMYVNGDLVNTFISGESDWIDEVIPLSRHDVVRFFPIGYSQDDLSNILSSYDILTSAIEQRNYYVSRINVRIFDFQLYNLGIEYFDFSQALSEFSMTDFIKEIMFRKSLTPITDVNEKHIKFRTLEERVSPNKVTNISSIYAGRVNELYTFGGYAKMNTLELRQDKDGDVYGNSALIVNNENINSNRNLYTSKFYAPSRDLIKYNDEYYNVFKIWEKEVKESDNGVEVDYKPLRNRFYMLREEKVEKSMKIGNSTVPRFRKASTEGTLMSHVVQSYYNSFPKLFDSLRIHNIKLKLNAYSFSVFDLDRVFFIEQEASYYLLNRLIYESGSLAEGEFIKINDIIDAEFDITNNPPSQLGDSYFNIPKSHQFNLTLADFIDTTPPYIDDEGDEPESIKIVSFGDDNVKIYLNNVEITADTVVSVADIGDLEIRDLGNLSVQHSTAFDFKIQSYNNPNYSSSVGRLVVNVAAEVNVAPIAIVDTPLLIQIEPELNYDFEFNLNGCESYDPNNDQLLYEWELGGNTPSSITLLEDDVCNPRVRFQSNQLNIITFEATLTVTDPYGLDDTASVEVTVTTLTND